MAVGAWEEYFGPSTKVLGSRALVRVARYGASKGASLYLKPKARALSHASARSCATANSRALLDDLVGGHKKRGRNS
jgi:hypothetical protein